MQKSDSLIRTKLRQPFIRPSVVSRMRLQARIEEGLQCPLTLVIAPAGFGKTTLVASSLANCRMQVAWLSLDDGDNQVGRFLIYLIAALQSLDDQIGSEAAQLMAGMQQARPEAVLISLINDLDSANTEFVLVLDDYQLITNPAVHEELVFFLEHCPLNFHLVIATRSDPPLPLSRLRARGQVVELRVADLRFTVPEAAQFLNEVMDLHLDAKSVSVLEERTEGWIAGLQMAALSMRDREDIAGFLEGFSGTHRYILDYLLEEVLASQSPEIQHFLLYTSILERLTAPLCDAVLENHPHAELGTERIGSLTDDRLSASVLEYLDRENLFLVSLDNERTWYRYHHLFADLLKARLQKAEPGSISLLHIRASAWLEHNGFILEAIQHLFAAHEINQAADLIDRYAPARIAASDPSVLQMANHLPQEMILARPKIGLYQAWLFILHSQIRKAIPLLNDLARQLAEVDSKSEQRWIQTIISTALAFLAPPANPPGIPPLPDSALLEEIPTEELLLRNAANYLYGMALARRGHIDRAVEFALKCIQQEKSTHGTSVVPTLAPFLTRIYLMQGLLRAATSLCHEFLDPIKESDTRFIYSNGSMKIDLGEVLYERNCLEEAEQYIRDGLRANEPWRNIMTDGFGLTALTRVLQAKGDLAGAMQAVEKFETRLREHSQPREFDEDLATLKIQVQLASGDHQNAFQWADQVQMSEDFRLHSEHYRLTLARIRLAQGRYADVEEVLTRIPSGDGSRNRITREVESNLLLAAATAGRHRLPDALGLLDSCIALAEPEGYIQVFLNTGEQVRELLIAYFHSAAPGHHHYAQILLDAFPTPGRSISPVPQSPGLIEPLTERELEVLRLIALGKTNLEIAAQLYVSPGTVKAHTANIYRKLDVANRTEAVGRARQLSIIP